MILLCLPYIKQDAHEQYFACLFFKQELTSEAFRLIIIFRNKKILRHCGIYEIPFNSVSYIRAKILRYQYQYNISQSFAFIRQLFQRLWQYLLNKNQSKLYLLTRILGPHDPKCSEKVALFKIYLLQSQFQPFSLLRHCASTLNTFRLQIQR